MKRCLSIVVCVAFCVVAFAVVGCKGPGSRDTMPGGGSGKAAVQAEMARGGMTKAAKPDVKGKQ